MGVGNEPDLLDRLERQRNGGRHVHVVGEHPRPVGLGQTSTATRRPDPMRREIHVVEVEAGAPEEDSRNNRDSRWSDRSRRESHPQRRCPMTQLLESDDDSGASETVTMRGAMGDCLLPAAHLVALSRRPDLARAVSDYADNFLTSGQLPPSIGRLAVAAIAKRVDCHTCPSTMDQNLAALGLDVAVLDRLEPDLDHPSDPTDLHRRIISLATKAAAEPQSVTDEDVERVRAAGLTEGELIELALLVAFSKLMITWADVSSVAASLEGEGEEP